MVLTTTSILTFLPWSLFDFFVLFLAILHDHMIMYVGIFVTLQLSFMFLYFTDCLRGGVLSVTSVTLLSIYSAVYLQLCLINLLTTYLLTTTRGNKI